MINKIDLRIINLNKLNRTTMDEWCDDFNVKVGDKVPPSTFMHSSVRDYYRYILEYS